MILKKTGNLSVLINLKKTLKIKKNTNNVIDAKRILLIRYIFFISCSSTEETNFSNDSQSDVALYREGMKYLKSKEFDEAIEIFTELEIIHPYQAFHRKVN